MFAVVAWCCWLLSLSEFAFVSCCYWLYVVLRCLRCSLFVVRRVLSPVVWYVRCIVLLVPLIDCYCLLLMLPIRVAAVCRALCVVDVVVCCCRMVLLLLLCAVD